MSEYPTIHNMQLSRATPIGLMMDDDTPQDEFEQAQQMCDVHVYDEK